MLSDDLSALKAWFDTLIDGGHDLTPAGARAFSDELGSAADKAAALEIARIAPTQMRKPARNDDNVIDWPVIPRHRPFTSSDGDAA